MVNKLWDKLATLLGLTPSKHDTIKLWVINDPGISYMQKCTLSSEQDLTMLKELLSMSAVMIDEENLQKLDRAGLAHLLYETQESQELSTPQQKELFPMTCEECYRQVQEAWNDET